MKFSEFKKNIDDGIKNVITDSESSDRTKSLEAILNIVNTINRSLILEDVLELVLKNAIRLTQSERGFIVLQNAAGELEFKLGLNEQNENLPKQLFEVSNTVVEDVFKNLLVSFTISKELVFLSNVPSIYDDVYELTSLKADQVESLIASGVISGGMIPKVRSGIAALENGVGRVVITDIDGLTKRLAGKEAGTVIVK